MKLLVQFQSALCDSDREVDIPEPDHRTFNRSDLQWICGAVAAVLQQMTGEERAPVVTLVE